jgi:ribosome-associated protein
MTGDQIRGRGIEQYIVITATRSAGPGGQNVNKVSSRIEARITIESCPIFSDEEKSLLIQKLQNKLTMAGELIVTSQIHRSQLMNREEAVARICTIIALALTPVKARRPTRPTKASVERRLKSKEINKQLKQSRRKDWL